MTVDDQKRRSPKGRGWSNAALDCWLIAAEASLVVPLRVAKIARGGDAGRDEMRRMVAEKVEAQITIAGAMATGQLGSSTGEIVSRVSGFYLHHVRENRRRLTRRKA